MRSRFTLLAALVVTGACKDDVPSGPRKYEPELVTSPASISLVQDDSKQITAYVRDRYSSMYETNGTSFTSDNQSVAGVAPGGLVIAMGGGSATITVSYFDGIHGKTLTATIPVTATANPLATISLTPETVNLFVGDTSTVTATLRNAAGDLLTKRARSFWVVAADTSFASISSTGMVTARKAGTARVVVSADGKSDTTTATVALRPVQTVTFGPDPVAVRIGATVATTVTLKAANGETLTGRTITYSTGDPAVATVDANGVITGVARGQTTITATSEGKTGTLTVAVVQ